MHGKYTNKYLRTDISAVAQKVREIKEVATGMMSADDEAEVSYYLSFGQNG